MIVIGNLLCSRYGEFSSSGSLASAVCRQLAKPVENKTSCLYSDKNKQMLIYSRSRLRYVRRKPGWLDGKRVYSKGLGVFDYFISKIMIRK